MNLLVDSSVSPKPCKSCPVTVVAKVKNFVLKGWPSSMTDSGIHPYFNKQTELTVEGGCVFRGIKGTYTTTGKAKSVRTVVLYTSWNATDEETGEMLC